MHNAGDISHLYLRKKAASEWDYICYFRNGSCQRYRSSFKGQVSIAGSSSISLQNISKEAEGIYRFEDKRGECVACLNVSVMGKEGVCFVCAECTFRQGDPVVVVMDDKIEYMESNHWSICLSNIIFTAW